MSVWKIIDMLYCDSHSVLIGGTSLHNSPPPNIKRIVWHLLSRPQTGLTPTLVPNHFYETDADGYVPDKFFTAKVACSNLKQMRRPLLSQFGAKIWPSSVKFKTSLELKWAKYEAILELVLVMAVLYEWTLDPSWVMNESRSSIPTLVWSQSDWASGRAIHASSGKVEHVWRGTDVC